MMDRISLELVLTATDEASQALKTVLQQVDQLRKAILSLEDLKVDPFAGIVAAGQEAVRTVQTQVDDIRAAILSLGATAPSFANMVTAATTAGEDAANAIREPIASLKLPNPLEPIQASAEAINAALTDMKSAMSALPVPENPFAAWADSLAMANRELQAIMGAVSGAGGKSLALGGLVEEKPISAATQKAYTQDLLNWYAGLSEANLSPEERAAYNKAIASLQGYGGGNLPPEAQAFLNLYGEKYGAPSIVTGERVPTFWEKYGGTITGALGSAGKYLSSLPMSMLTTGMTAYMGMWGLQALTQSTMTWPALQQMMAINHGTPQENMQAMGLLAFAGISPTEATSYLQGIIGNLRTTLAPSPGTAGLSKQAVLLQSLGITQQTLAQSPSMVLATIARRYQQLMAQGQGTAAAQLLQLTGTTQLGTAFLNYQGIAQQVGGILPANTTAAQIKSWATAAIQMQTNMTKLSLAFSELAAKLTPIVEKIVKVLTDLSAALAKAKSPFDAIGAAIHTLVKDIGGLGTAIVGIVAGLKTYSVLNKLTGGLLGTGLKSLGAKALSGIRGLFTGGAAAAEGAAAGEAGGLLSGLDLSFLAGPIGIAIGGAVMAGVALADPKIRAELGKVLHSLVEWAGSLWGHVHAEFNNFAAKLGEWAGALWADVHGKFNQFVASLGQWAGGLWKGVSTHFSAFLTSLGKWAGGLWGAVSQALGDFTSSLVQWAQGLWGAVSQAIGNLLNNVLGSSPPAPRQAGSAPTSGRFSHGVPTSSPTPPRDTHPSGTSQHASAIHILAKKEQRKLGLHSIGGGLYIDTYKPYAGGGIISEPVAGMGLNTGMSYLFGEAGPEAVVPLSAMRPRGGGGNIFNINISINGAGKDARQLAQEVANEMTRQLKIRANFEWGY